MLQNGTRWCGLWSQSRNPQPLAFDFAIVDLTTKRLDQSPLSFSHEVIVTLGMWSNKALKHLVEYSRGKCQLIIHHQPHPQGLQAFQMVVRPE